MFSLNHKPSSISMIFKNGKNSPPLKDSIPNLNHKQVGKEEKEQGPAIAGTAGSIPGLHFRFWASLS
jgi:hypothetical protein